MVSFNKSNAAIVALLAASLATSTDAYGRTYSTQSRPSTALRSSLGRSLFSDMDRMMNEMDTMMDDMLGDLYSPYSFEPRRRMTGHRPSAYLLPGMPSTSAVANSLSPATRRAPVKNSLGITQDDKQFQLSVEVPGANAEDINLQLENDGRVLRISGETKREEGGLSWTSQVNRAFTLGRDVDTDKISAEINNGVLTVIVPKVEQLPESVRKIDIGENKMINEGGEEVPHLTQAQREFFGPNKYEKEVPPNEEVPKMKVETAATTPDTVDDSVIDLDAAKE